MTKQNLNPPGVLQSADESTPPVAIFVGYSGSFSLSLQMSPEAFSSLEQLAHTTGSSIEDVISKAFILYEAAALASRQGKAVGIAPSPDVLETEFVGFEAEHAASQ
jgi:hypothetical protein